MATAQLDPIAARIVAGYGDATTAVRQRVEDYISRTWGTLSSWRDGDIAQFVSRIVPVIAGSQVQLAAMTDAYLAAVISANLGPTSPVGIPRALVSDLTMRGVDITDVYSRVGPTIWTALGHGQALDVATAAGLTRALAMAATDLQLARTHSAQYVLSRNDNVVGYSRVPSGDCCDLCALASDQTYHTEDLMPIHDRCGCDVEPIFASDQTVESPVDPERLAGIDIAVAVADHGELGPVLTVAGQSFTGPDDL